MICDDVIRALSAFQDGELPRDTCDGIAHHLEGCPRCRSVHRQLADIAMLVRAAPQPAVPETLADRVRDRLSAPGDADRVRPRAGLQRLIAPIVSAAAAGLVGVVVGMSFVGEPVPPDAPVTDIFAAHVRSLMDAEAPRIVSSDQHTVRPWFAGRLPFAPSAPDLAAEGYPLIGGRLDYVGEQLVAALTYHRRQHKITVFVWPANTGTAAPAVPPPEGSHHGYNLVGWQSGGLAYTAISDLNPEELAAFRTLFEAGPAKPQGTPP